MRRPRRTRQGSWRRSGGSLPLMATERQSVTIAFAAVVVSSLAGLAGPLIIAHAIDT